MDQRQEDARVDGRSDVMNKWEAIMWIGIAFAAAIVLSVGAMSHKTAAELEVEKKCSNCRCECEPEKAE